MDTKLLSDKTIGLKGLPEPLKAEIDGEQVGLTGTLKTSVLKLFLLLTLLIAGWSQSDAWAQRFPIKGEVVDEGNSSLSDVTVQVKGQTFATSTDSEGQFTIEAEGESVILIFSSIGFAPQEVVVEKEKSSDPVIVRLTPEQTALDDVVVVAFGEQKRTEVVGAMTTIKPSELRVPSSNLTTALAGRVSGVIAYQRSGEPGADNAEFFIRGVNTFGYKVDPLILIDNLEVSTAEFARLTTEDIASFSIMKDATATALYGARGANGVIIVKTKEGKEGSSNISFRVENSLSAPTKNLELADPITYMMLHNEAVATRDPLGVRPYSRDKIANTVLGSNSVVYPNTDWQKEILKTYTFNQKAHLNISGGGKVAQYYVAGSFTQDNGMLKVDGNNNFNNNIDLKTYQLRSNTNIHITPTSEVIVRLSGIFDDYTGPMNGGSGVYNNVMQTNPVLFPAYYPKDEEHAHIEHTMFGNYEDGNYLNPYAEMVRGYKDYSRSTMNASIEFKQNLDFLTEGLSLTAMGSTSRYSFFDVSRFYNPFYYQLVPGSYDRKTGVYSIDVVNPLSGTEYLSYNEGQKEVSSVFHFQSILNYNHTFFEKHNLGGLLVFLMRNNLQGNAGSLQTSLPYRNSGLSGRLTYSYDNRYSAEFNFGYNGSERFHESKRFGFFPSAGVAWTVSNEKFWNPDSKISKMKLRATYGIVGNDQIGSPADRFFFLSEVNMNDATRGEVFGEDGAYSRNGVSISRYDNREITWETSKKLNLGLELGLLNNKIDILADYFTEYRSNILMTRANIPTTMGLSAASRANVGEASSHGVDISVDVNHYFSSELWLTARGNFTYATSQYEVYEEPVYPNSYSSRVGQPLTQTWGYIAERLFIDDAEVANAPAQNFGSRPAMAGDIKYADVNGDGQITTLDRVPIGYPTTPEIVYGFGASSGYRRIDFSLFFQGSARSSFWINQSATAPFIGTSSGTIRQNQLLKAYADDHWSEENRNSYALWPRLDYQANSNNQETSTWFMRNGSFLRLKQAEFGYTLPVTLVNRVRIKNVRFFVNGTNLWLWSPFKLWDIEQAGRGLDYPVQRVYNVGIQVSL
ncbi:MAG TPA: TonB-dependent receptor [Parapedobacter sp.]|uniref:SusC/RagA family TonB-linked outer membrane protein n=1 Tax=Parapedobacter sp. TaxID=1958893 RepID=UPI002CFBC12B|nr:TonB-dependent receptor [Parapedobacter sp.]HWK57718.1 TonB-dependent receptor [Parapedobacter sp.]